MGQDGAEGGGVQGAGEKQDEQLRGRVRKGRVPGGDKPKRVEEGTSQELIIKSRSLGATTAVEKARKTGGRLDPAEMVKLSSSEALRRMRESKR